MSVSPALSITPKTHQGTGINIETLETAKKKIKKRSPQKKEKEIKCISQPL